MKRLLPLFFILTTYAAFGQTSTVPTAAQTLRLARATYEQGRLHEVPAQLNEPILAQMSKQEKVSAYTLLCLSYIYLEEAEKADQSMLNILMADPYFKPNPVVDPAEFVALYKTFRTRPIYRIGAKIGVNATQPNVVETVTAVTIADGSEYKYLIGFQAGASVDKPINDKFTLHADAMFIQKRFSLDLIVDRGPEVGTDLPLKNEFTGVESQSWLSLPISVEYKPLKATSKFDENWNPYISLGISTDYLLSASLKAERLRDNSSSISESTYDLEREKINLSALAGIGIKKRVAGGYFVAEVRYLYGLTKVNSESTAYANQQATWEQGYADPIFKLSSLSITGSYIQNIFSPKKIKRKK